MNAMWWLAPGALSAGLAVRPRAVHRTQPERHRRRPRRRARERAIAAHYPDALELIVLAIRAGHLPASALRAVQPQLPPPLDEAFAAVTSRVAAGQRFADALVELTPVLGPRAHALVDSFAAADRYGLPLAPVLDRLADEARHQRGRANDVLARQLPVRLALPLVLCTLPSFVMLAIAPLLLAAVSSLNR